MCLNPVIIPQNKRLFRYGIDPKQLVVPCGHCLECREQKESELYVRVAYEYYRYIQQYNGLVFFVTLTHNKYSLPVIDTFNDDGLRAFRIACDTDFKMPYLKWNCFSKYDLRQFFKKLADRDSLPDFLQKLYPVRSHPIKHLCVCEYGTEEGFTHRPHYHLLLFVPFKIEPSAFKLICEFAWSDRTKKSDVPDYVMSVVNRRMDILKSGRCLRVEAGKGRNTGDYLVYLRRGNYHKTPVFMRIKGFVKYSHEHGATVNCVEGTKYLLKYMHKEPKFLKDNKQYLMWANYVHDVPALTTFNKSPAKRVAVKIKGSLPFTLISDDFGTSLEDEFDFSNPKKIDSGIERIVKQGVTLPNDIRHYPFPKYILRRLFQQNRHYVNFLDGNKETFTYLSDAGLRCAELRYRHVMAIEKLKLEMLISPSFLSLISPLDISEFNTKFHYDFYSTVRKLRNTFCSAAALSFYENAISYGDLVMYRLILRCVPIPVDYEWLHSCNDILTFRQYAKLLFAQRYKKPDMSAINNCGDYYININRLVLSQLTENTSHYTFDTCELFRDWDFYCEVFDWIARVVKTREFGSKQEKSDHKHKVISLYNSFIYSRIN